MSFVITLTFEYVFDPSNDTSITVRLWEALEEAVIYLLPPFKRLSTCRETFAGSDSQFLLPHRALCTSEGIRGYVQPHFRR